MNFYLIQDWAGDDLLGEIVSRLGAYLGLIVVITINCSGVPWLKKEPTA
jgi:hypothetical protein